MTFRPRLLPLFGLMLLLRVPLYAQNGDEKARSLVQRTIQEMGGNALSGVKDAYGSGRFFILKEGGQSWTKFWDYYKWPGKARTEFDRKQTGIVEIYDLTLGKGWIYEYGKVKEKTADEMRDFRLAEKRNLINLFRDRWREPGTKVFYYGPGAIDTLKPMEALEFVDAENYSVTVYFEEGNPRPTKLEYKDRTAEGLAVTKSEQFFRWFKVHGVLTPKRVEFYTNDRQTGLVEYSELDYNLDLPDTLFQQPLPLEKNKK